MAGNREGRRDAGPGGAVGCGPLPATLTVGEDVHVVRQGAQRGERNIGGDDATLLLLPVEQLGIGWWWVTDSVGSLSPSSSSPESIRLTVPGRTGTHLLNACVASVAGERNKDNCSGNLRVTVRP